MMRKRRQRNGRVKKNNALSLQVRKVTDWPALIAALFAPGKIELLPCKISII
jgi:hypothetical protein